VVFLNHFVIEYSFNFDLEDGMSLLIETERLRFRPYKEKDLPFLISLCSDPQVMRYIGKVKTPEETEEMLQKWLNAQKGGMGICLAIDRKSGEKVGHSGVIEQIVDGRIEAEIGYWLLPKYWGKGLGTEMAAAFRDYAFETLKLHRLISIIQPGNKASIKVARKIGMEKEKETVFRMTLVHIYAIKR
jgi:RimJ/RimL family protein N-acetyltransferase